MASGLRFKIFSVKFFFFLILILSLDSERTEEEEEGKREGEGKKKKKVPKLAPRAIRARECSSYPAALLSKNKKGKKKPSIRADKSFVCNTAYP